MKPVILRVPNICNILECTRNTKHPRKIIMYKIIETHTESLSQKHHTRSSSRLIAHGTFLHFYTDESSLSSSSNPSLSPVSDEVV